MTRVTTRRIRKAFTTEAPARLRAHWNFQLMKARRRHVNDPTQFSASPEEAEDAGNTPIGAMFLTHEGRSIHKWIHYLPAYQEQFEQFRDGFPLPGASRRPLRFLEVGVAYGGSLQLWRRFFGAEAAIWGVDVNPLCKGIDDPDLEIRIGSAADPSFLRNVVTEMGGIDIVLDDGSHIAQHQQACFNVLFPLLADGGLYIVEDTHTSYWWDYSGGYRHRNSFIGQTKALVDDMHGWYHSHRQRSPIDAQHWIPKITIYDSMVVISKSARSRPQVVKLGQETYESN